MPHRRRISLLAKGLAVIAIPLVFEMVFTMTLLQRQSSYEDAQRWAIHTKEVLMRLDKIVRELYETQSKLRGAIITDSDPIFDVDMHEVSARVQRDFNELRALTRDNPAQGRLLAGIFDQFSALLARFQDVREQLRAGKREEVFAQIKSLVGQKMTNALVADVESFRAMEMRLDAERLERLRQQAALQNRLLLAGAVVNVLTIAGVALFFTRGIARRIAALAENVERIGEGRELLPVVGGRDEIAALDRMFHRLSADLALARAAEAAQRETIERRAAELEKANRSLDEKNREVEMFVYSVSHDLRSPLVNLQGFSKELNLTRGELLQLAREDFSPEARTRATGLIERNMGESIHYMQTAVTRLGGIIDALLRVARAGRVEMHPRKVEMNAMFARIIDALRGTIAQRGAEISVEGGLPQVWADPAMTEQLFANLIQNAVHYLDPARPGRVAIGSREAVEAEGKRMRVFFVRDNGRGIPAAALSKMFGLFQRFHSAEVPAGEGIGLTLARRIAERHGGQLWVETEEGKGSTFFVSLPGAG